MKITTSEIVKNDFAAMGFYDVMNYSVKQIRENIDHYKDLRKINTSIFAYIYALCVLSEHANNFDVPINLKEVIEWKEILLKYFDRIQKKIPEDIRDDFKQNLQKAIDIIISKAKDYPEYLWIDQYHEREIKIRIKNKELKKKYLKAAEENEKYKNMLGNALHNYLTDCLEALENIENEKIETSPAIEKKQFVFSPTYIKSSSREFSYLLDNFYFFLGEEEIENQTEINAYDIECAIKLFLKDVDQNLLSKLRFDTESSLLSVQTNDIQYLIELNSYLLQIATDENLKNKYLNL